MAEVLGKLDSEADASMLTNVFDLTPLEQANVNLAVSNQGGRILAEAQASEKGVAIGHYIVGLPDGKVVAASYNFSLGQ